MTDRQFEEFLRESAKDYNRPKNGVPRDEMWAAIDAARKVRVRGERPTGWFGLGRGLAAAVVMWVFPVAAVAGGAALAYKSWTDGHEPELVVSAMEGHRSHDDGHQHPAQHIHCEDGDSETRLAAMNALLQMDADLAVPILVDVLERRDECSVELRHRAVFLVSQHETSQTVDILLQAIHNDPDEEVRHEAVFWMGQVSSSEAVTALESVLQDVDDIELQKKVVFALSQHGSSRATRILRDIALDRRAHEEVREQAIFWLGQEGSDDDVSALMDLYDRMDSDQLKERIIFAVSQSGTDDAVEWLLSVANNDDESLELRENAVFWLGQIESSEAAIALESVLIEGDSELQEDAIFALAQDGSRRSLELLRDYAGDRDASIESREEAIFWLGQEGSANEGSFLMDLYGTLESEELKDKVLFSVSQNAGRDGAEWLLDLARNDSEPIELRKSALFWVGQEGDIDVSELTALYEDASDMEMKEQIIFVISQCDESEAVEQLIAIARGEENTELRDKALFWLGQTDDPRAAEFLAELIIRPNR